MTLFICQTESDYTHIKWAASRKKGPEGIFDRTVNFTIYWVYIILRLVC